MNIPKGYPYAGEVCFLEGSTNLKDYLMGTTKMIPEMLLQAW